MNKKFKKLILPMSILAALQVNALGLGTLQVDSALDENLIGKIPLVFDRKEKIDDITISLATDEDYKRVGLDKSYVPSNIEVRIANKGKNRYIELTSNSPVSEPIVSLLLVVDWANGHLLREYTLLLDPPLFNTTQTQDSYTDNNITVQPYNAPDKVEETVQYEEPTSTYQEPVTYQELQQTQSIQYDNAITSSGSHEVTAGESLWGIASLYAGNGVSTQQMMVTIFNNNTSAFSDNDMNLLKKGVVLTIPSSDEIGGITQSQALAEVRSQINKWSSIQQEDRSSGQQASSSTDYAIELIPPKEQDSYNDSNSASGTSSDTKVVEKLNQAQEELISSKLENNELQNKITELEQILKDQEAAISLKDNSLAQLQQQLMEAEKNKQASTDEVDVTSDILDEVTGSATDAVNDIVDTVSDTGQDVVDDISDTFDNNQDNVAQVDNTDTLENTAVETPDESTSTSTDVAATDQTTFINKPRSFMDKVKGYKKEGLIGLGVLLLGGLLLMFKRKNAAEVVNVDGTLDASDISVSSDNMEENVNELVETSVEEIDPLKEDVEEFLDTDISEMTELNEVIESDITLKPEDNFDADNIENLDTDGLDLELDSDLDNEVEENVDLEYEKIDVDAEIASNSEGKDSEIDSISGDSSDSVSDDLSLDFDGDSLNLDLDSDGLDLENDDLDLDVDDLELSLGGDDLALDVPNDDLLADDNVVEKISEEQQLEDDLDLSLDFNTEEIALDNVVSDNNELEELVFETDKTDLNVDTEDMLSELDGDLDLTLDTEIDTAEDVDLGDLDFESEVDKTDDNVGIPEISLDSDSLANVDNSETIDKLDEEFNLDLNFDEIIDDDANDTKLDLARAYFEMGDINGAKQMVEEIINDGNDAQIAIAKELKDEIESS